MTEPRVESPPPVASSVFGAGYDDACRYARLLCGDGVERGLVGPREPGRIWTRHLLNCAVVTEVLPHGVRVVDVGSGAGLPGLALAIRRPDLRVDLLESSQRRCEFLLEAVDLLGLAGRVAVVRSRVETAAAVAAVGDAAVVTARAVAPLDRLLSWCAPLLATEGMLALIKGKGVRSEIAEHAGVFGRAGLRDPEVVLCGDGTVEPPVPVVVVHGAKHIGRARRSAVPARTGPRRRQAEGVQ